MLATLLEDKVRAGRWHALIDKVYSELNVYCSAHQVLGLVEQFLAQGIMEGMRTWTSEAGVPQGAVLHLSNDEADRLTERNRTNIEVTCRSKAAIPLEPMR